jgi:hypothetical protein
MDRHAAAAQGLGYLYQPRFALLRALELPEETAILIEKDDDLDFVDVSGRKTLASLKHKSEGDRLTDLDSDFWKSILIWQKRYDFYGRTSSSLRFLLFTTSEVSPGSFLNAFVDPARTSEADQHALVDQVVSVLEGSTSTLSKEVLQRFQSLSDSEQVDFLSRISIVPGSARIDEIRSRILTTYLRSVQREYRETVLDRLEGWWHDTLINMMTGKREDPIIGFEISDMISSIAEEYRSDNLPIEFSNAVPETTIEVDSDPRLFVVQLRHIELDSTLIRKAILDYYRAFEQRSSWLRHSLLVSGELEDYENRLVDEWDRYRLHLIDGMGANAAEEACRRAGRDLYGWADLRCAEAQTLRIRERVTEPYVIRGGFHILANMNPPRVYWHPQFLESLANLLKVAA